MDPQATLRDLIDAVLDGDEQLVAILVEALENWLRRGGFPPETVGPRSLGDDWHTAITRSICQLAGVHVRLVRERKGGHDAAP